MHRCIFCGDLIFDTDKSDICLDCWTSIVFSVIDIPDTSYSIVESDNKTGICNSFIDNSFTNCNSFGIFNVN